MANFLFNARIISGFRHFGRTTMFEIFLSLDASYEGSNGTKDIFPHPHIWQTSCLMPEPLPVFGFSEEPLCLKYFSRWMLLMKGQMVQKTSPLTLTNGHFLRIISGFWHFWKNHYLWNISLGTDDCYEGSNGTKKHLPSPHNKWQTSCLMPVSFPVFAFRKNHYVWNYFSLWMIGMKVKWYKKISPLTPWNGHFLFNASIISCFCISEEPLSLKLLSVWMIVMEGQMVQKHLPSPHKMATSCLIPESFPVFAFRKNHYLWNFFHYGWLLWRVKWYKKHLPSPHKMATSCLMPVSFPVFAFRKNHYHFFRYGWLLWRVKWYKRCQDQGFWILTNKSIVKKDRSNWTAFCWTKESLISI